LIFVVASVDVGVYSLFKDLIATRVPGMDVSGWGITRQIIGVVFLLVTQALFNHFGIGVTTLLTDVSGYLILVVAVILVGALLAFAPSFDLGRLFTFTNFTGDAGGGVWPASESMLQAFLVGLILVCYTITGFDASAHTSEEARDAARVPNDMLQTVVVSCIAGYIMVCSFVLAMPSVTDGAVQGFGVFGWLMENSGMPVFLRNILFIGIVVANYL
jgi:amino acid transporter